MSTGHKHKNSESVAKNIRFKHELIEQIEQSKDSLIPFGAWVQQACKEKIERDSIPVNTPKDTHVNTSKPVDTPVNTANEKRKIQAIAKLAAICDALSNEQKEEVLSARYPKSTFRKLGAIYFAEPSRDSVALYWNDVILPKLEIHSD